MTAPEPRVSDTCTSIRVRDYRYELAEPLEVAASAVSRLNRTVKRWRYTQVRVTYRTRTQRLDGAEVESETHLTVSGGGWNVLADGGVGRLHAPDFVLASVDRREGTAESEPWCAAVVGPILADAAARYAADTEGES